jgi:hypothetical protein
VFGLREFMNVVLGNLPEYDLSNLMWRPDVISLTCHGKKGDMCHVEMGE